MTITRDIFDKTKKYFGASRQNNTYVYHWDENETNDELRYKIMEDSDALFGASGVVVDNSARTSGDLPLEKISNLNNNIEFRGGGFVVVGGRVVELPSANFKYYNGAQLGGTEPNLINYVVKGKGVTVVSEVDPGVTYNIQDSSKNFTANHDLVGCVIMFHSGTYEDEEFEIVSVVDSTTLQINADFQAESPDPSDNYTITPKRLTTPGVDTLTSVKLVTWFEDIDEEEDTDLADSANATVALRANAVHRKQLRWCIYNDWSGTSGTDYLDDFIAVEIGQLDRTALEDEIDDTQYNYTANIIYTNDALTEYFEDVVSDATSIEARVSDNEDDIIDLVKFDEARKFGIPEFSQDAPLLTAGLGLTAIESSAFRARVHEFEGLSNPDLVVGTTTPISVPVGESWAQITKDSESAYTQEVISSRASLGRGDTVYASVYRSTNIDRIFPMGFIPQKQGFDWVLYHNGSDFNVRISPGQYINSGMFIQMPYTLDIDPTDAANQHLYTAGWNYLYLTYDPTASPMFGAKVSTLPPYANGQAPRVSGVWYILIGMLFFDGSDLPVLCSCRKNKVIFDQQDSPSVSANAPTVTYTQFSSTGTTNLNYPLRSSKLSLSVDASDDFQGNAEIAISQFVDGLRLCKKFEFEVEDDGGHAYTEFNLGFGEDEIIQSDLVTNSITRGNIKIIVSSIEFDPIFTPDTVCWTF